MSLLSMRRRRLAAQKGFNLIEAAIVLGIVGLVVGGIWVAATSVYANLRNKTATDQLLKIAQGVRALYATSANMANAAVDVTQDMARANILPGNLLTTTATAATSANTVNPWNGNVGVLGATAAGAGAAANATAFAVVFSAIPSAACVDFLMRNAGSSRDTGLNTIVYGASAVPNAMPGTAIALTAGTAISLANAQTACDSAGNSLRSLGFVFSLRG